MTKRTHFQATFADGTKLDRASDVKVYSHAWRVTVAVKADYPAMARKAGDVLTFTGFSGTAELARKAAATETHRVSTKWLGRDVYKLEAVEIVPVAIIA